MIRKKLSDKKRSRTICGKSRRYPGSDHNGKRMESRRRAGGQSFGGEPERSWRKQNLYFWQKEEDSFREKEIVKGLIADISHQTRTPVANMKLYTELLEDEVVSQNGKIFISKLKNRWKN